MNQRHPVEITLTLRPLRLREGEAPTEVPLRRLLKNLLRVWGFQCVGYRITAPLAPHEALTLETKDDG